jgi:hypothetical protein
VRVWALSGRVGSEVVSPWGKGTDSLKVTGIACPQSCKRRGGMLGLADAENVDLAAARRRDILGHWARSSSWMLLRHAYGHCDQQNRGWKLPWNRTILDSIDQSSQAMATHRTRSPRLGTVRARTNGIRRRDYTIQLWTATIHIHSDKPDAVTTPHCVQISRH